jgi:hypothetical protein
MQNRMKETKADTEVSYKIIDYCGGSGVDLTLLQVKMITLALIAILRNQTNASIAVTKLKTPFREPVSELYRPSDCRLSAKLVSTFLGRGCHVVSMTDPYDRTLGFLYRSRDFFLPSSSSIVLTWLSGLRFRPTTSQKIW